MPLYRDSVAGVRAQIAANTLVPTMSEQFAFAYGYHASPAEQRSWERSLMVLTNDLHDAGLDEMEVLLEYQLPLTSRREARGVSHSLEEVWSLVGLVALNQRSVGSPDLEDLLSLDGVPQHLDLRWVDPSLAQHIVKGNHPEQRRRACSERSKDVAWSTSEMPSLGLHG